MLTAAPIGSTNGTVALAIGSTVAFTTTPLTPIAYAFTTAGTYTVSGVYTPVQGAAQGGILTVQVVEHAFTLLTSLASGPDCGVGQSRTWTVANLPSGVVLQLDNRLQAADVVSNDTHTLTLTIDQNVPRYIVSRLNLNGPILDATPANGFQFYNVFQTYNQVIAKYADGSQLVEMMLILSPVVPDLTVTIDVSKAGVTLDDGTTTRTLTAADFDNLGQVKVRFIMAANTTGANCHVDYIYQGVDFVGKY